MGDVCRVMYAPFYNIDLHSIYSAGQVNLKGNSGFYLPPNLAELIGVVTLPPLLTMVAMFKDSLDVDGETVAKVVMSACARLGVETFGLDVKQMAEASYSKMVASGAKPAAAAPSIVELAALFRREIGVDGSNTKQVIAHTCARLGIEIDGLNVRHQASRCFALLQQRSPGATSGLANSLGAKQRSLDSRLELLQQQADSAANATLSPIAVRPPEHDDPATSVSGEQPETDRSESWQTTAQSWLSLPDSGEAPRDEHNASKPEPESKLPEPDTEPERAAEKTDDGISPTEDATSIELDFADWPIVGPPLHDTMELIVPFAPYLRKLSLKGCPIGGRMPKSEVWDQFVQLSEVDLDGTGFETGMLLIVLQML